MLIRHILTVVSINRIGLFLALVSLLSCSQPRDDQRRMIAQEYVDQGKFAVAIKELEKLDQPTSEDHSWRGELLIQLGRPHFDTAGAAFHDALKLDGQSGRALYGLGLLAVFKKEFAKAEDFARKALQVQPNWSHARNLLAGALIDQKRYGEAEVILLELERDPTVATIATGNLGELYLREGKLTIAEAKLKQAIAQQPDNFNWHRLLGEVYDRLGQSRAALAEYRRALELVERSQWADKPLLEGIQRRIAELER